MLVKHLRRDFYEILYGKTVLIMSNIDVDAVCATKILTELMKVDGFSFTLCPVATITDMKNTWDRYSLMAEVVLLVNCGLTFDIRGLFGGSKEKIIFILDSHRPVHVANFYDETNSVRVLSLDEDSSFDDVPEFDEIFRPDSLDSDSEVEPSDEDEVMSGGGEDESIPRKRLDSREKMKRLREWREKRDETVFKYTQFCYFGPPSTLIALEVSWAISRGDIQYVWWAAIALTDAFVLEKIQRSYYLIKTTELGHHMTREMHAQDAPTDCLKVNFEKELGFLLYKHWNLYDSIRMTPYSACILKTWTLKGEARLHEMLGELGFPQKTVRQKYPSMDLRFRKKVHDSFKLATVHDKYKFEELLLGCFVAKIGFMPKISAFDAQLACLALLENPDKNSTTADKFLAAMSSLSKYNCNFAILMRGVDLAKMALTATYRQMQELVNMHSIKPRDGFLFAQLPEGGPNGCYFTNPNFLVFLAQFTQRAASASAKTRRWASLPFILAAPATSDSEHWAFVGIKPLSYALTKNLFGKIFETISEKMPGLVQLNFVDSNIVHVRWECKDKFLQLLEVCMI